MRRSVLPILGGLLALGVAAGAPRPVQASSDSDLETETVHLALSGLG